VAEHAGAGQVGNSSIHGAVRSQQKPGEGDITAHKRVGGAVPTNARRRREPSGWGKDRMPSGGCPSRLDEDSSGRQRDSVCKEVTPTRDLTHDGGSRSWPTEKSSSGSNR